MKKKKEDGPLTKMAKKNAQGPLETKKIKRRKARGPVGKATEEKKQKLENVKTKVKETIEKDKATEEQWSNVNIEEQKLLQSLGLASLEVMEDDDSWSIVRPEGYSRGKRRIEDEPVKEEKEVKKKKKKTQKKDNNKENIKTPPEKKCKLQDKLSKPAPPMAAITPPSPTITPPVVPAKVDIPEAGIEQKDQPSVPAVVSAESSSAESISAKTVSTTEMSEVKPVLKAETSPVVTIDKPSIPMKTKVSAPTVEITGPSVQSEETSESVLKVETDAKPNTYAYLVAERRARKKMLRKEKIKSKKLLNQVENKPILTDEVKEKKKTKRLAKVARAKARKAAEKQTQELKKEVAQAKGKKGKETPKVKETVKPLETPKAETVEGALEATVEEPEQEESTATDMFIKAMRAETAVINTEETAVIDTEETAMEVETAAQEEITPEPIKEDLIIEDERVEALLEDLTEATADAVLELTEDEKTKGKIWLEMGVCDGLVKALVELGFTCPTPIQYQCIPAGLLTYKDVIGAAETGSGKTLAFGIPLIQRVSMMTKGEGVRGLVMAPTRELALQVTDHLKKAAKYTSVSIVPIVGGIAHPKQMRLLSHKPEIIVATPGRYWQLLQEHEYLQNTATLRFLVIDEADRMVEDGHFVELTDIVGRLPGPTVRNTFLFSATLTFAIEHMGDRASKKNPKKKSKAEKKQSKKDAGLEMLVRNIGIRDKREKVDFTQKKGTAESLTETYLLCDITDKDLYLYYLLLNHPGKTLVFCNSIDGVMNLVHIMQLLGLSVHPLHSALQQRQRFKFLDRFKERDSCTLIATDVAARGLDIAAVDTVIHYQLPATREAYIHRSGRTARAEKSGLSIGLVGPKDFKAYRKISSNMSEFPMETNRLKNLRPALQIARQIFKIERLHTRPDQADAKLEALAKDAGLDTKLEKSLSAPGATTKKEVKVLKAQLKQVLSTPIVDPMCSQRYLNKDGQDSFQTLSTFSIGRKALEHNDAKKKKAKEENDDKAEKKAEKKANKKADAVQAEEKTEAKSLASLD